MKIAKAHLISTTPYSVSKAYFKEDVPELPKETKDAYERRTWRARMHVTKDGNVFIPGASFAGTIKESAKRLGIKVPGKGQKTYTKAFDTLQVINDIVLPMRAEDVPCDRLFVPSDGIPGSGKRVLKHFPRVDSWEGDVTFYIWDDLITDDIFSQVLMSAGLLVGVGRFRPERRGYFGRFRVESIEWNDNVDVSKVAA